MEPHWPVNYPGSTPPSGPLFHDAESMMVGAFMSELRMGQSQTIAALDRQTKVLESIHEKLATPVVAPSPSAASAAPAPSIEKFSVKDWVQIAVGVGLVLGALTGRLTWSEALNIGGKPFGF